MSGLGPDVRYVWQSHAGPSAARNRGVRHSVGRYVAFLEYPDREELVDSSIGFDNGEFKAVPEIMLGTGPDVDP